MLHSKKLLLLLSASITAASLAHAAVRSITDVEVFTNRSTLGASSPSDSSDDDSHTSTYSGVECGDKSADTQEGCNKLLGISNAIATACDGGRYNCSAPENPIPLDAYPACDTGAVDEGTECASTTNSEQCQMADGTIKYNCRCKNEYISCDSSRYGDPEKKCTDSAGNSFYSSCLPACNDGVDTASSCTYKLNQEKEVRCYDTSTGTVKYDCAPACSYFGAYTISSSTTTCTSSSLNGEVQGICTSSGSRYVCGCSASEYMAEFDKYPSCTATGERPDTSKVCTAEKKLVDDAYVTGTKYLRECTITECGPTDRSMVNHILDRGDWENSYPLFGEDRLNWKPGQQANFEKVANTCYKETPTAMIVKNVTTKGGKSISMQYTGGINKTNEINITTGKVIARCRFSSPRVWSIYEILGQNTVSISEAVTCTCADSYKYVSADAPEDFITELKQKGATSIEQAPEGMVPFVNVTESGGNVTVKGVCFWDAQTAIDSKKQYTSVLAQNRIRYQAVNSAAPFLPVCQDWEEALLDAKDSGGNYLYRTTSTSCDGNSVLTSCARKISATIANASEVNIDKGMVFYQKMSYCSCPRNEDGTPAWYDSCADGQLRGGRVCSKENVKYYELCLPKCRGNTTNDNESGPKYVELKGENRQYFNADAKCSNIKQNKVGTYASADSDEKHTEFYNNNLNNLCLEKDVDTSGKIYWQCNCGNYKTNEECSLLNEGSVGAHSICLFDSTETETITKYVECLQQCPTEKSTWLVDKIDDCLYDADHWGRECVVLNTGEDGGNSVNAVCFCPTHLRSLLEECGGQVTDSQTVCDSDCQKCYREEKIGIGETCKFDSKDENGEEQDYLKKYSSFGTRCTWFEQEAGQATLKIVDSSTECGTWANGVALTTICYKPESSYGGKPQYICGCPNNYQTLSDYCANKVASGETDINGEPYTQASCEAAFKGVGVPCSYDVVDGKNVDKYRDFGVSCPSDDDRVKGDAAECNIGDYEGESSICYKEGNEGISSVVCGCPKEFGTKCYTDEEQNILDPTKIRGGLSCTFDGETKYEKCLPQCENTPTTPVALNPDSCPLVDGVQADTGEMCFNKYGDETAMYTCRCPKSQGYQTIEEYCSSQKNENGVSGVYYQGKFFASTECKSRFIGVGEACTFDGNGTVKYKSFSVVCPTDRPLYYSADECSSSSLPGLLDYYCYESANLLQQRVVCKCPDTWIDVSGNREIDGVDTRVCKDTEEAAGLTCSFDGVKNMKYEKCYTRCDKMDTNGKGISYLEEEDAYELDCKNLLGDGATFGVDGFGGQCSQNHTLAYPCYCKSSYKEQCLNNENKTPAPGALACTVGGTTYYEECANNDCSEEGSTVALIDDINTAADPSVLCQNAGYGPGVSGKRCGKQKIECSCDARDYTETCDYPYERPDLTEVSWCKYGSGSTLMKNGVEHFRPGEWRVKPVLAQCGKNILNDDGTTNTSYTINVAATESQCKALYGTGVKTQLCEYEDNPNKRAYNCYYNPSEFKWTEDNCPVRHILGDNYIIKGGVRYYDECDCHPAYTNHKYNCAGMLSGGACSLQLTAEKISSDSTLRRAAQEGLISTNDTLSFYPYCQCTADYNQECDGERNIGVGEPCNGKYKACECKPDELPENWADNYYGCPGGKKPTGVTKPNGCGGKYYQCEVTECTWQHTEKCLPPLVGIDPCQDNEGNIGGYKSCKCPDGYVLCPEGTVGTGEPCMLKGQYYYKEGSCVSKETCTHGESQTCQGSLQIGVNPCTRNGITYFEYCVCASGYDKPCNGDNEVGVGSYCTLNGTKYYTECATPASTCTTEHKEACDTNQSSYDPCVSSDNKILYKCKCPSNWSRCETTGAGTNAESCSDSSGTYYSSCAVSNECTASQELTYAVCTESQIGTGGSCLSINGETQVTKYAQCEETSACKLNGYQYTCQGYDQGGLGDSCIDEMGNRLYKSCGCPKTWVECPGKNNIKGQSCTPLSESGILGTTVYESCTCDRSIYKSTCEATGANQGVIPSKSRSCTEVIYGEGEQPTYYESCDCSSEYKYTCTANGQLKDESNYCQKTSSSEKLYTHCECSSDYSETCAYDATNPGLSKPQDTNKACTPLNSESGDNATKYSSCECGLYYTETCSDPNQIQNDAYKCTINGVDKYNQCDCPSTFTYSCKASGQNKGIIPVSEGCSQIKYVNGTKTSATLYQECGCAGAYKFSCNNDDEDNQSIKYNGEETSYTAYSRYITSLDYCEAYMLDDVGGISLKRRFKECRCDDSFKTECTGEYEEAIEGSIACLQVEADGSTKKLYQYCQCKPSPISKTKPTGITIGVTGTKTFDQNTFSAMPVQKQQTLQEFLNGECVHYKNAELSLDGCGAIYYKCLASDSYKYYKDEETDATNCSFSAGSEWQPQGAQQTVAGTLGTIIMYTECGCDASEYVSNKYDCKEANEGGDPSVFCYLYDNASGALSVTGCTDIGSNVLYSYKECVNNKQETTYSSKNCYCNEAVFTSTVEPRGSYYKCVDKNGARYKAKKDVWG